MWLQAVFLAAEVFVHELKFFFHPDAPLFHFGEDHPYTFNWKSIHWETRENGILSFQTSGARKVGTTYWKLEAESRQESKKEKMLRKIRLELR